MVNKLAKGIVRAGRAAVLVVGLAVVLALVLGVATTALAGKGGGGDLQPRQGEQRERPEHPEHPGGQHRQLDAQGGQQRGERGA